MRRVVSIEVALGERPLKRVRSQLRRFCASTPITRQRLEEVVLAVNEAVANSLEHGGGRSSSKVIVEIQFGSEGMDLQIIDFGDAPQRAAGSMDTSKISNRGRGLGIIRDLMGPFEMKRVGKQNRLLFSVPYSDELQSGCKSPVFRRGGRGL
jgi:anti-sigma regulatory factor (Ser/Thr protein kinase)